MPDYEDMDAPNPEPQVETAETPVDPPAKEPVVQTPEEREEAEANEILAEEEAKHKQKSGSAKLKERLAREREEATSARLRAERAEAELDALRRAAPAAPPAPPTANLPSLDQFIATYPNASLDDYESFKVEFAIQKAHERMQAQEQNRKWDEGVQKVKAEIPDLDEAADVRALNVAGVNLRGAMADTMLRMGPEVGVKVLHHLAQNPEEARRIAGLSPLEAAMELGSLKAGLASKATPKPKPSSAPPPLQPVRSPGATSSKSYATVEDF